MKIEALCAAPLEALTPLHMTTYNQEQMDIGKCNHHHQLCLLHIQQITHHHISHQSILLMMILKVHHNLCTVVSMVQVVEDLHGKNFLEKIHEFGPVFVWKIGEHENLTSTWLFTMSMPGVIYGVNNVVQQAISIIDPYKTQIIILVRVAIFKQINSLSKQQKFKQQL